YTETTCVSKGLIGSWVAVFRSPVDQRIGDPNDIAGIDNLGESDARTRIRFKRRSHARNALELTRPISSGAAEIVRQSPCRGVGRHLSRVEHAGLGTAPFGTRKNCLINGAGPCKSESVIFSGVGKGVGVRVDQAAKIFHRCDLVTTNSANILYHLPDGRGSGI